MEELSIRPAREADLADLVRIYNHYVERTHVTFDVEPFSVEARRPWLDGFAATGPHRLLVAETGSQLVGYASSGVFKAKPAYRTSVETSVYVARDATGRGVGRRLYAALLDALRAEPGLHRAYAGIALPNPTSVALHERLGFTPVGTFREVGFKLGRYWHVRWFELAL